MFNMYSGIDLERHPDMRKVLENQEFGDESDEYDHDDSASDREGNNTTKLTSAAKETFVSMSEIASASYEARKVNEIIQFTVFIRIGAPSRIEAPSVVGPGK